MSSTSQNLPRMTHFLNLTVNLRGSYYHPVLKMEHTRTLWRYATGLRPDLRSLYFHFPPATIIPLYLLQELIQSPPVFQVLVNQGLVGISVSVWVVWLSADDYRIAHPFSSSG